MEKELDITHYFFSEGWLKIIDEVTFFSKKSRLVWYRGQNNNKASNERYPLLSGLFRQPFSLEEILEWEEISYKRFLENGYDLHKTDNQWDLLYLMQQYGVKTRLLDWSESFAVALYFATRNWQCQNPCSIWLLDPLRLNEIFHNLDELKSMSKTSSFLEERKNFTKSMALSPRMNTYRSMFQKGFFTLQGNTKQGLEEEENGILLKEHVLKHISIGPDLRNDVEMFLELSGINQFTLFPDLTGLASYVNQWTTVDLMKKKTHQETKIEVCKMFRRTPSGKAVWVEDENTYK
ncbi:FRG domain-containing protein [Calidifontibacillus erzurumensis]|uniref:FRG domain-containing protein n=1 Tax=Calidifontibacillus erzurumensis TaxID=2741433 RepID=A0A8J8K7M0_9BACI|nr:FRG domain-containing protein [Calidifontibacillus erzurumensis]NSL50901.1 FRG domain-containing protein [Calidifontibacillus erzurumensis]